MERLISESPGRNGFEGDGPRRRLNLDRRTLGKKVLGVLRPGRSRRNIVVSLLTVGGDGYPNVCLLSPFQVLASSEKSLLFAVYEGSKTLANLREHKNPTLVLFLPPAAYYIKGDVERVSQQASAGLSGNVLFRMRVTRVTRDYYTKAPITSSAAFEESGVLSDYSRVYQGLVESANRLA